MGTTDTAAFGDFQFTVQGKNIYIGQVINFSNPDKGEVKFMDKCGVKKNSF